MNHRGQNKVYLLDLFLSFTGHQVGILLFLSAAAVIAISNSLRLKPIERYPHPTHFPPVSILVPARNEEKTIRSCVQSLLSQDYPDFEVLVLDDGSTDQTGKILSELKQEDPKLTILAGTSLPVGWLGKPWACHQLSQAARGELLLFIDADTRLHPKALQDSVSALQAERAGLVSVIPFEETQTWGERLTVPVIAWSLFSFFPFPLAYRLRLRSISAAIGQFMMFERKAYEAIGGHQAVKHSTAEDLELARLSSQGGLQWRLLDGTRRVSCRMYTGFSSAIRGLSKSLFAAFGYRKFLFTFIWAWLAVVFLEPLVLSAGWLVTGSGQLGPIEFSPFLSILAVVVSVFLWGLFAARLRSSLALSVLYPVLILITLGISVHSLYTSLNGQATWKGRALPGA